MERMESIECVDFIAFRRVEGALVRCTEEESAHVEEEIR